MIHDAIPFILVVEDDPALQDIYRVILSSQGYRVATAYNGIDALNTLKNSPANSPDLILLDIFMPRMDGREFLKNLDLTKYPGMKIVVSSNLPDRDIADELIALGATRFVLKSSMSPNDLLTMVETMLDLD